ncbi:hypothetical protein FQN60_011228, partial [Etheostoma spectabile]
MARKVEYLLSGLYTLYNKSGVNLASLKGYPGIVRHLEEKSQEATNISAVLRAKIKGFLNKGKDGGVLRFCCLLHDTIYKLSNLSRSLQ